MAVQLWFQLLRCWGLSLHRTAQGGRSLGRRYSRRLGMQRSRQLWIGKAVQGKVEWRGGGQEAHGTQGERGGKQKGGGSDVCSHEYGAREDKAVIHTWPVFLIPWQVYAGQRYSGS